MSRKVTKHQLELQEKKLELQERRAMLKEAKEKLEFERAYIVIQKADQLRWSLSTSFIINTDGNPTKESGFSDEEFMVLMKKYYSILKSL